jgi:hypothetical protein
MGHSESYAMEGLATSCGEDDPASVMADGKEYHFIESPSCVLPGKTESTYPESKHVFK